MLKPLWKDSKRFWVTFDKMDANSILTGENVYHCDYIFWSGYWAANERSATTYERRLELEYFYCKNCNLILDIKCVFLTIASVLFKTGAK